MKLLSINQLKLTGGSETPGLLAGRSYHPAERDNPPLHIQTFAISGLALFFIGSDPSPALGAGQRRSTVFCVPNQTSPGAFSMGEPCPPRALVPRLFNNDSGAVSETRNKAPGRGKEDVELVTEYKILYS